MHPNLEDTLSRLEVRTMGQGAPLILVHGIQGTQAAWEPVLPYLADRRVILPNLPGRAGSPRCANLHDEAMAAYYHLDHYADLLAALVQRCVQQYQAPVSLAGWSMGVSVILRLWQRHGGAGLDRLILISGTPCAAQANWFAAVEVEAVVAEAQARAQRLGLTQVADPQAVAWTWRSARALDQREVLPTINIPTLVLHGQDDQDSPLAHGEMLARGIPGAQWRPLPGQAHAVLATATADVGSAMREFLG